LIGGNKPSRNSGTITTTIINHNNQLNSLKNDRKQSLPTPWLPSPNGNI